MDFSVNVSTSTFKNKFKEINLYSCESGHNHFRVTVNTNLLDPKFSDQDCWSQYIIHKLI